MNISDSTRIHSKTVSQLEVIAFYVWSLVSKVFKENYLRFVSQQDMYDLIVYLSTPEYLAVIELGHLDLGLSSFVLQ